MLFQQGAKFEHSSANYSIIMRDKHRDKTEAKLRYQDLNRAGHFEVKVK